MIKKKTEKEIVNFLQDTRKWTNEEGDGREARAAFYAGALEAATLILKEEGRRIQIVDGKIVIMEA